MVTSCRGSYGPKASYSDPKSRCGQYNSLNKGFDAIRPIYDFYLSSSSLDCCLYRECATTIYQNPKDGSGNVIQLNAVHKVRSPSIFSPFLLLFENNLKAYTLFCSLVTAGIIGDVIGVWLMTLLMGTRSFFQILDVSPRLLLAAGILTVN